MVASHLFLLYYLRNFFAESRGADARVHAGRAGDDDLALLHVQVVLRPRGRPERQEEHELGQPGLHGQQPSSGTATQSLHRNLGSGPERCREEQHPDVIKGIRFHLIVFFLLG